MASATKQAAVDRTSSDRLRRRGQTDAHPAQRTRTTSSLSTVSRTQRFLRVDVTHLRVLFFFSSAADDVEKEARTSVALTEVVGELKAAVDHIKQ